MNPFKRNIPFSILLLLLISACGGSNNNSNNSQQIKDSSNKETDTGSAIIVSQKFKLKEIVSGLNSPIGLVDPSDGSKRLFIAEQGGIIKVLENGKILSEPLINLKDKIVRINSFYDERGLLGFCLNPNFKNNGIFYVYYSAPSTKKESNHKSILAEYKLSASKNIANPTERIILEIEEPESNHNGGQLAFGPDGFLYIAVGDGGGAGDEHGKIGNGQNLNTLLGKILRIDINQMPYGIPKDNPFISEKTKPEIYAYGLRNPWRFSFDKNTGKLFCADVGQDEYEEVNIIEKGANYGWRIMEANHCFNPNSDCKTDGLKLPIHEYPHSIGLSITGGFVYRGNSLAALYGKYIFGDWTGPLFYLSENNGKWSSNKLELVDAPEDLRILSFGQDARSEIYLLTSKEVTPKSFTGSVYQLTTP